MIYLVTDLADVNRVVIAFLTGVRVCVVGVFPRLGQNMQKETCTKRNVPVCTF